ncbi:MAG: outer membrane beta-barrel protein, partial [Nitrospiria bacterium]
QGQVDNGWNNGAENNNGKYYGIQLGVTPIKPLPIVINYAESSEPTQISTGDALSLLDVIVTYNATDALSFMLNYDNATQKNALASGDASWDGIAVYGRYAITPMIAVALRLEQFNDADGYRTDPSNMYGTLGNGGQKLTEETLTLEHNSLAGCLVRLEYRHDSTNLATSNPGGTGFTKEDGTPSQTQDTLTLGVVHTF